MVSILKIGFNWLKKALLVFFVYALIISLFSYFITKDKPKTTENPIEKQRQEIYTKINDKELQKTKIGKLQVALYRATNCSLLGEACTNNPEDGEKNYKNSVVSKATSIISFPFMNPPASGIAWTYDTIQEAGFIPKTYAAQGIGFSAMKPILGIWRIFRNTAYMILVIVLVAIGFMIMFRMKLNPQTVISVENALPRIVISMILITFSFAISGFLIDLMYVFTALCISVLSNNNVYFNAQDTQTTYLQAYPWKILESFYPNPGLGYSFAYLMKFGNAALSLLGGIQWLVRSIVGGVSGIWLVPLTFHSSFGNLWQQIFDNIQAATFSLGKIPSAVISILSATIIMSLGFIIGIFVFPQLIIGLLIWFTLIFMFFRIFALLFSAYLQIILLVIFSPFYMLLEAIPGSKTNFSSWLKNIIGELLPFPIVIIILLVGKMIMETLVAQSNIWTPPFLAGIDAPAMSMFIGLGIMLLIPDFIKMAKEAIGAKGLGINLGLGTFFAGGQAALGGGMGLLTTYSSIAMAAPGIRKYAGKLIPILGESNIKGGATTTTGADSTENNIGAPKARPG